MADIYDLADDELRRWMESQQTEFKASLSLRKEGLQSLCAMLNADTAQGRVAFGINPDGTVRGLDPGDLDTMQRTVAQHIQQGFDPQPHATILIFQNKGKNILQLEAQRPSAVVLYEFEGRAYIREGSRNRQLTLADRAQLNNRRNRDQHNGPWQCDRCGSIVGQRIGLVISNLGIGRHYNCRCGGELWPLQVA